jgi:UTP--glucose-1-phosphate uridylyltransferase
MKVIVPAAGLGTRLLPSTKEQPKEMLPLFTRSLNGQICLKPLLQLVFEQLYGVGFREFYFVIGREKRAIEDHFTPDREYVDMLEKKGKVVLAEELRNFYHILEDSTIIWINQPEPRGFGDAVLKASFVGEVPTFVHAGDTYIISDDSHHLKNMLKLYEELDADVMCLLQEVEDPRQYGVAEVEEIGNKAFKIKKIVEKPEKPPTKLAVMPLYVFHPDIFRALKETPLGKGNELQLTDGIQRLIDWGRKVYTIKLGLKDLRFDIGSIETYWDALRLSYHHARGEK